MANARSTAPPSSADRLYQGDSGRSYHDVKRAIHPDALEWVLRLRAAKFQPWIRDTDTVFELGVGAGWNLARLRCARRIGSDPAAILADRVRAHGIEFHTDSRQLPDASVDVALAHHVLEHVLHPADALQELARLLKPGGRLILYVPWETERRHTRFDPGDPDHHLYHWNVQNLGNLVSLLGWHIELIRARRYGYDRLAANLAARAGLGEPTYLLLRAVLVTLRPLREIEVIARR